MTSLPHYLFAVWMVGGIQTVFQNMKGALAGHSGTNLSWVPVDMYPDDWITRIPPISLNGTWRNSMATWNRMRPCTQRHGTIDAAYVLDPILVTFLWRFRRQVPYLLATDMTPMFCAKREFWYAVPEFDPSSNGSRLKQAITASVYRSAFHCLPWSAAVRDSLVEDYGVPEKKITVLPPGIDLSTWQAYDRLTDLTKPVRKPFTVLHVGTDFHRKGADLLLALAREPEFCDAEFHFVTSDFPAEQPPNVFIHRDLSPNSDPLKALYHQADVFALPTRADTYSMVALEAMASGLPVVISRVGGIEDIIVEGETGFLMTPDDLSSLRNRLRYLRAQPGQAITMGAKGRRRVENKYDISQHVDLVMQLLASAARSRARKGNHE